MPQARKVDLSDEEINGIVSALQEDADDDGSSPMQVIRGGSTKNPSQVRVVDEESIPIDDDTRRELEREKARRSDSMIQAVRNGTTDPKVLALAAEELAEEIFSLKHYRDRLEREGRDITQASGRRVTAIKAMIETHLKQLEMTRGTTVDFESIQMKIVLRLIFSKIKETLEKAGYGKQEVQNFFQLFQTNMESFQIEAQRLIDQELKNG